MEVAVIVLGEEVGVDVAEAYDIKHIELYAHLLYVWVLHPSFAAVSHHVGSPDIHAFV